MDPAFLATTVTSFLAPYLAKAGTAVLDRATAALPDAAAHLWDTITQHFQGKPAAAAAATDLAKNASDEDQQAAFALQLKMAIKNDPEFAAALQDLMKKSGAEPEGGHNVTITTGNVTGSSFVVGNNNKVQS